MLDLSNNRLSALPPSLPAGLTHLYVNGNPLRTNTSTLIARLTRLASLASLDIQFLSVPLILNPAYGDANCLNSFPFFCNGPRVAAPTSCTLGNTSACQWTLRMYDAWDEPCHVGGAATNLTLGMECDDAAGVRSCRRSAPMVDQRNGSFAARVGDGWVRTTGRVQFRFYVDGAEFRPVFDSTSTWAGGCDAYDYACAYDALRTVDFVPRTDCPKPYSQPDASGYECECAPGYKRSPTANHSDAALLCVRDCRGDQVSVDGTCVCPTHSYDPSTVGGTVRCAAFEWVPPDPMAVARNHCASCPPCARCEAGTVTLREGWRLADRATGGPVFTAFRCPYADANRTTDATAPAAACPSMALPLRSQQPPCRGNHTGERCAVCAAGFTRHASSDNHCEPCAEDSYAAAVFGVSRGWLAILAALVMASVAAALWRARRQLLALKALVFVHIRILLGWAQVVSLRSGVLDIV